MDESTLMKDILNDVDYLESIVTNSEAPVNDYTQNVSHTFNLTADPEFDQKQMELLNCEAPELVPPRYDSMSEDAQR